MIRRAYFAVITVSCSSLLSFLILAVLLQIFYTPPQIVSGWRSFAPRVEVNELGFRGQSISYSGKDFIVLLVGDSHVESLTGCTLETMPEKRLEFHLSEELKEEERPIKVFTLGASGYGQDQEFLVLKEYFDHYRADVVVHWLTPGNDVWNNMFPTNMPRNGRPKPTFWLEGGELKGPSEAMGEKVGTHRITIITVFQRLLMDRDGDWEKFLPEAYKPMTDYQGEVSHDWQERWDGNVGLMRCENLDNEKSHMAILLSPPSPRMHYGLELTHHLIHHMEKLAHSHGAEFYVVGFEGRKPVKQIVRSPNDYAGRKKIPRNPQLVQVLNGRYYRTSLKQFRDNIEVLTRDSCFLFMPIRTNPWRVSDSDGHLNEQATDQVMADLARWLKPDSEKRIH